MYSTLLKLLKWKYSRICDSNTFRQAEQVTWIMHRLYRQPAACKAAALMVKQFWRQCPAVKIHTLIWPIETCCLVGWIPFVYCTQLISSRSDSIRNLIKKSAETQLCNHCSLKSKSEAHLPVTHSLAKSIFTPCSDYPLASGKCRTRGCRTGLTESSAVLVLDWCHCLLSPLQHSD